MDRVVAVVGDQPILESEIQKLKEQVKTSSVLAGIYRVDPKNVSDKSVLNWMLEEKIVHAAVKDLDVTVSDTEVDTQIASIAKQNNLTIDQLQSSLKREGVPFDVYKRNIRAQLERRNIFDRELRRGGGTSESDLRQVYEKKARPELEVLVIGADNAKELQKIKTEIATAKPLSKDVEAKYSTDSLGWVSPDSLDTKVAKALMHSQVGDVVGPLPVGGKSRLLFVAGRRVGSEEEFQKIKGSLAQESQASDYEQRFAAWLERKKTEMHIVMNPL